MDINKYAEKAAATNLMGDNSLYHLLGLVAEIGELVPYVSSTNQTVQELLNKIAWIASDCDAVAKAMRNDGEQFNYTVNLDGELTLTALSKELGDSAWYYTMLVQSFGFYPSDVLKANIVKLTDRAKRNVIKGSGDSR
jgi:NTP pyrophosphatase (non-canonical NTP hydrolase)